MKHIFTWVPAYQAIVARIATMRNAQDLLITALIDSGVNLREDEDINRNKIALTEIDPFTFLCHLNVYGDSRRKNVLNNLCKIWDINIQVEDVAGIPSVSGQKIWLFPYRYDRRNNEINRLWDFFEKLLSNTITDADFQDVLRINGVGLFKITEVMYMVNSHQFLCINGKVTPYLNKKGVPNTGYNSWTELMTLYHQIKIAFGDIPFYKISYDGFLDTTYSAKKPNYYRIGSTEGENGRDILPEMISNDIISIGWSDLGDLDLLEPNTRPTINNKMLELGYNTKNGVQNKSKVSTKAGEIYRFYHDIEPYDVVLINKGEEVRAIAKVYGANYAFINGLEFPHARVVEWIDTNVKGLKISEGNLTSVWQIGYDYSIQAIQSYLEQKQINERNLMETKMTEFKQGGLNTILYGPPGTGKTYKTIKLAVRISDPEFYALNYNDFDKLKKRFDELLIKDMNEEKDAGQISFTTFHQSLSYEDFIEGLKPESDTEDEISYDVKPGIFKIISNRAYDNYLDSKQMKTEQYSFEEAFQLLKDAIDENPKMPFSMKTPGKEFTITGFTGSSIKFKKASGGEKHTLSISTLRDFYYGISTRKLSGVGIYYPGIIEKLNAFKKSEPSVKTKLKNYVLIIDEINRANVSQVFGELITLIEDNKRLGTNESLECILPYSKEKFGVPINLYIIGTMNTADRSIEALDTALRRRFSFQELMPNPEALKNVKIENLAYSAQDILTKINERIEVLLDRDHTIGHSYFMNVSDEDSLRGVFKDKIIPLLQEYFYGDYGKIGLVLGKGFVEVLKQEKGKFAEIHYDGMESFLSAKYKLKPIDANFDIIQAVSEL